MRRYLFLIIIFAFLGLTSCGDSSPEAVTENVYEAAVERNFSSIRDYLTSNTLRTLLRAGGRKWAFNRYCYNLTQIPLKAQDVEIHFMRSNYSYNRSRVVISFFVTYRYYRRKKTRKFRWVLNKKEGGWKIVAF